MTFQDTHTHTHTHTLVNPHAIPSYIQRKVAQAFWLNDVVCESMCVCVCHAGTGQIEMFLVSWVKLLH